MRIAALYDIHGNLPALEAVLVDVREAEVDQVVVGGDVLPGPMPRECLDTLGSLDLPVRYLIGNGDRDAVAARRGDALAHLPEAFRDVVRWSGRALTDEGAAHVTSWPETLRLQVPGVGRVLFCHATPRNVTEIFTEVTPEELLLPVFAGVEADVVVCGHTHMTFDRRVGDARVVNAGSVGMPFGAPGADWLLLAAGIEPRRTVYDSRNAAERIRATAYPGADVFADGNVLTTPDADHMREVFEGAALR